MATTDQMDVDGYDYDLIVVGGGSGGISCAKESAECGARVALFDFVTPSNHGTQWGIGGTCVNVGCIPKKLMHYSSLLHESMYDAKELGWNIDDKKVEFSWSKMIETVNNYVRSLNWGYKVQLNEKNIKYIHAFASFVDAHTIKYQNKSKKEIKVSAKYIVLALGGRPRVPNIIGKELGITSDDIFWLKTEPKKTLLIGASYISLETAGFLHGMGYEVTVAVRSILLRGFDEECSKFIGNYMEQIGIKFRYNVVPIKLEKTNDNKIRVTFQSTNDENENEEKDNNNNNNNNNAKMEIFDTVLFATGRAPETKKINLNVTGVKIDEESGKIVTSKEQTNISHIYAIGDIVSGAPELTPVAIQAGKLLAKRLFKNEKNFMDYTFVPTTIFTPLEYSCVGYSEEESLDVYGDEDIEVFYMKQNPLETYAVKRKDCNGNEMSNTLFLKIICVKSLKNRIVGFHFCGPNAGEVMQGFALALKLKAKKEDLDNLVGIHPTCAEWFTLLKVTKSSGEAAEATAC